MAHVASLGFEICALTCKNFCMHQGARARWLCKPKGTEWRSAPKGTVAVKRTVLPDALFEGTDVRRLGAPRTLGYRFSGVTGQRGPRGYWLV
jgi:hypothetical protein